MDGRVKPGHDELGRRPCLFGGCNCIADPASLGALCSGGAGFVSAMMAALAASARTAQATPLGRKVPQVDRLAVRIVTDNIVIQFVPNEKRGGLAVERRGGKPRRMRRRARR